MAIVTVGIDLANNVFAIHGVDESGRPALVRTLAVPCAQAKRRAGAARNLPATGEPPVG